MTDAAAPGLPYIRARLFLMMLLELFIWGAWLPLIFGYLPSLGFTPTEQSVILNAFPVASIVGMFFSNQCADRRFAAEKFLAVSHLIAGLAILLCGFVQGFRPFIVAGVASLALAAFSLTLPHTPPKKTEEGAAEKLAWLEALRLLRHPFVLVLWLVTLIDSFVHMCYFNWTGVFLGTAKTAGGVG